MSSVTISVEIEAEQEEKLRRLAAARGCSAADVVREAIASLPEEAAEPEPVRSLRAAGLISEYAAPAPDRIQEADRALDRLHAMFRARGADPRLVEALIEDRDESDRRL